MKPVAKVYIGAVNGFSLVVNIAVNGVSTEAVLDTAAHTTIISDSFAEQLPEQLDYTQPVKLVSVLPGVTYRGHKAKVRLEFGNIEVLREVVVAPVSDPVLLGIDILQEGGCVLDMVLNELHAFGARLDVTIRPTTGVTQVRRVTVVQAGPESMSAERSWKPRRGERDKACRAATSTEKRWKPRRGERDKARRAAASTDRKWKPRRHERDKGRRVACSTVVRPPLDKIRGRTLGLMGKLALSRSA